MSGLTRLAGTACLLLALPVLVGGCAPAPVDEDAVYKGASVSEDDPLMMAFRAVHPDVEILVSVREEDITDNGLADLVVIFRLSPESNRTLVVHEIDGEPVFTNDTPAPIENQRVSFRDIDNEPPTELIIQGSKGAAVGFAIYRITDGVLEDIFGEGMEHCC